MLKCAIKFEGTVAELVEWAQTTFANTGTIRIRGSIHLPEIRDRPDRIDLLTMRDDAIRFMEARYNCAISPEAMQEVIDLLNKKDPVAGNIPAIKAVRLATHLFLKEAKEFVESEVVQRCVKQQ